MPRNDRECRENNGRFQGAGRSCIDSFRSQLPRIENRTGDSEKIGKLHRVQATSHSSVILVRRRQLSVASAELGNPHGCLADLGWYCIR